jgi:glutathione S-transferase
LLDQYKYPNRHPNLNQGDVLNAAITLMLKPLDEVLDSNQYVLGNKQHWIDVAIFPFIRQFSMVNPQQFEQLPLPALKNWLTKHLQSELFNAVMARHPVWIG